LACVSAFAETNSEGIKNLKLKAEQGDANAQSWLGDYYYKGEGTIKDCVEAYAYFNIAGRFPSGGPMYIFTREKRDKLEKEMTPMQLEAGRKRSRELEDKIESYEMKISFENTKKKLWSEYVMNTDGKSPEYIGDLFLKGEGSIKDKVEAYAYYNIAGIDNAQARQKRDLLEIELTPSQIEAGVKRSKELQAEKSKKWWQF
jgi:TPR repeat protein